MRRLNATLAVVVALAAALFANALTSYAQPGGPRQPDMTIDAAARNEVIENLLKRLNEAYVFPDVAKKMETAVRARAANKEYDQLTSATAFADALTNHLQEVSHDKHLRVRY